MSRLNVEGDRGPGQIQRWIFGAFAVLGLVMIAVLAIGGYAFARVTPRILLLAHMADRETYLVGEIAHRVDDIAATLDRPVGSASMRIASEQVTRNLDQLKRAMDELAPLLDDDDRPAFDQIAAQTSLFCDAVAAVMRSSDAVYSPESRQIFEQRVVPIVSALEEPTDRLIALNSDESARRLTELRSNLDHFQRVCLLLGTILISFLVGVAAVTLRIIGAQQRTISSHVAAIEQANRDLDAFAGRVAHDLRGPFTPILLAAGQLRSGKCERAQVEALAARIMESVARASRLIDGLLAFSRADQARRGEEACSAPEVVARALRQLDEAAAAADVHLESELEAEWVGINDSLLEQVLDNLLRNAINYMGARPERRVRVEARRDKAVVRFTVADTGPGIAAEHRARIFEPFFRIDPRLRGGVGLGLPTVRRIVEAQGGMMGVEDNPGGGALFWFTLPWRPGARAQERTTPERDQGASALG